MTIFDDAVMGPTRVDVEAPEIEDGQYVDGERVSDVNFFVRDDGTVVVISDHRVSTERNLRRKIGRRLGSPAGGDTAGLEVGFDELESS